VNDDEDGLMLDIYPHNLEAIIDDLESLTGDLFTHAGDFLSDNSITTFEELVALAKQTGPDQARFQAAAAGFSTAAAVIQFASVPLLAEETGKYATDPGDRSSPKVLFFDMWKGVAEALAWSTFWDFLCLHCPEPGEPAVDVLICQGQSWIPYVCEYAFFWPYPVTHCTAWCKASMNCFTSICAPTKLSAQKVQEALQNNVSYIK